MDGEEMIVFMTKLLTNSQNNDLFWKVLEEAQKAIAAAYFKRRKLKGSMEVFEKDFYRAMFGFSKKYVNELIARAGLKDTKVTLDFVEGRSFEEDRFIVTGPAAETSKLREELDLVRDLLSEENFVVKDSAESVKQVMDTESTT